MELTHKTRKEFLCKWYSQEPLEDIDGVEKDFKLHDDWAQQGMIVDFFDEKGWYIGFYRSKTGFRGMLTIGDVQMITETVWDTRKEVLDLMISICDELYNMHPIEQKRFLKDKLKKV